MALFAPGVAAGAVQGLDAYQQRMLQQQQMAERNQLMQARAYDLEQARSANARALQSQQGAGATLSSLYAPPPPVGQTPAPGQASVPMQPPGMGGAQASPVPQQHMPQGQPLPPMGQGAPQPPQIPPYRTVQGMQNAPQAPQPPSPGMAPPPVGQSQQAPQPPQLTVKSLVETMRANGVPEDQWLPQLERLKPVMDEQNRQIVGQIALKKQEESAARAQSADIRAEESLQLRRNADQRAAGKASSSSGYQIPEEMRDVHGGEYLRTLPATDIGNVKAISEGRETPSSLGYRGAARKDIQTMVNQYNPGYQEFAYKTKAAVQKDFTSGPAAKNVTSINTAIGHLGSLDALGKAVQTGDVKKINQAVNTIANETGNPNINNMQLAAQAVGDELMRTFRQVGASESEALQWQQKFSSANSPEQMSGAIKTAAALLESRIKALNDQWKRGMDTEQGFPNLLSPSSKKAMRSMGIDVEDGSSAGVTSGAPKVGTVDSGYRFKGGDPSDKNNWVKL